MTRAEIFVATGTAVLSFSGALLGVYWGSRLEESNWKNKFVLEQKKVILDRRVELMERSVRLFNQAPVVIGLRGGLDAQKALLDITINCLKGATVAKSKSAQNCGGNANAESENAERFAKEIAKLNGEFSATMSLASVYFGDEVRNSVKALGRDPWSAGSDAYQKVIDAMGRELNFFPN